MSDLAAAAERLRRMHAMENRSDVYRDGGGVLDDERCGVVLDTEPITEDWLREGGGLAWLEDSGNWLLMGEVKFPGEGEKDYLLILESDHSKGWWVWKCEEGETPTPVMPLKTRGALRSLLHALNLNVKGGE